MTEPISVMLVDDHELVRRGAAGYLQTLEDIRVVAQAESGEEAIRLAGEHVPDVVLMDLVMPGMDGVETTRKLRQVSPHSQVIVLTSYFKDEYIFPALKAGAISYLLKDVKASELVDAVRQAAYGEATLHPRVAARILQEYRSVDPEAVNPYSELTEREMDVLKLIANGYTNQKIAAELVITIGTVKGHVSNILSKLHLADRTEAAVFAWRKGIVRRGNE
jgi:NarL family two-component system response regulator LiaR